MQYEVVVSIYEKGKDEAIAEETVFETEDLLEAQEEFDDLTADSPLHIVPRPHP